MRSVNRVFSMVLIMFLMLVIMVPAGTYAAGTDPVLALTRTPSYGDKAAFQGVAYRQDGSSLDAKKYRVSLYLQVEEGGAYWVKPTFATPYAEVNPDGTFLINYATGGLDEKAKIIHLMLIPADYTPTSDFNATRARALDYVRIVRTEQGQVTVSPQRQAPDIGNNGKHSGLKVSRDKLALNIGFYTQGRPGDSLGFRQIAGQLDVMADYADTVRFYSAGGEESPAYACAHTLGLSVVGTAWLSGDRTADRKELDALIEHCNNGYVSVACVGSETLIRGDLTPDQLISDMEYVRDRLNDKSIPVTTADSAGILLENYDVRAACDLLMPNCYPYWEGVEISEAAESFRSTMTALMTASPGKEIIVSETGWPTAGGTEGKARAGETEAARFFEAVREWSLSSGTVVLWFAAADEPWKTADEGIAGAHWGLMDKNLSLKSCFADIDVFRQADDRSGQGNFRKNHTWLETLFFDVMQSAWYYSNVRAAYEYGLMVGMGDGMFSPEGQVKVSEIVTLACRLHDIWHDRHISFQNDGRWYDGYVNYALACGILRPGQFTDYERPAARKEVAEVFAAALPPEAFSMKNPEKAIPDVTGSEVYGPAVYQLYQAGILQGYDAGGSFAPDRTITRAETAAIATRIADPGLRL